MIVLLLTQRSAWLRLLHGQWGVAQALSPEEKDEIMREARPSSDARPAGSPKVAPRNRLVRTGRHFVDIIPLIAPAWQVVGIAL
jgi:hypothetical protein